MNRYTKVRKLVKDPSLTIKDIAQQTGYDKGHVSRLRKEFLRQTLYNEAHSYLIQSNMSLRDYFAAKASEKDIEYWMPKGFTETVIQRDANGKCYEIKQVATWTREQARYRYADAMLKAREL